MWEGFCGGTFVMCLLSTYWVPGTVLVPVVKALSV